MSNCLQLFFSCSGQLGVTRNVDFFLEKAEPLNLKEMAQAQWQSFICWPAWCVFTAGCAVITHRWGGCWRRRRLLKYHHNEKRKREQCQEGAEVPAPLLNHQNKIKYFTTKCHNLLVGPIPKKKRGRKRKRLLEGAGYFKLSFKVS